MLLIPRLISQRIQDDNYQFILAIYGHTIRLIQQKRSRTSDEENNDLFLVLAHADSVLGLVEERVLVLVRVVGHSIAGALGIRLLAL